VFTFKGPKSKLGLKILLNGFLVEFLDIDVNEKATTCHDFHDFKW
jgi:hypothetical protein